MNQRTEEDASDDSDDSLPVGWSSFRCDFYLALLVLRTDDILY